MNIYFRKSFCFYVTNSIGVTEILLCQRRSRCNALRIAAVTFTNGLKIYASVGTKKDGRTIENLERRVDLELLEKEAKIKEIMEYRFQTKKRKGKYKLQKQTVEPVFGIIKHVMGLRQVLLRSRKKVSTEW